MIIELSIKAIALYKEQTVYNSEGIYKGDRQIDRQTNCETDKFKRRERAKTMYFLFLVLKMLLLIQLGPPRKT